MSKLRNAGTRRLLIFAGLALLIGLVVASPVWAVETRSGDEVVIGPNEEVGDDLYVFANSIVVDGTIRGDLVAFGSNITGKARLRDYRWGSKFLWPSGLRPCLLPCGSAFTQ